MPVNVVDGKRHAKNVRSIRIEDSQMLEGCSIGRHTVMYESQNTLFMNGEINHAHLQDLDELNCIDGLSQYVQS